MEMLQETSFFGDCAATLLADTLSYCFIAMTRYMGMIFFILFKFFLWCHTLALLSRVKRHLFCFTISKFYQERSPKQTVDQGHLILLMLKVLPVLWKGLIHAEKDFTKICMDKRHAKNVVSIIFPRKGQQRVVKALTVGMNRNLPYVCPVFRFRALYLLLGIVVIIFLARRLFRNQGPILTNETPTTARESQNCALLPPNSCNIWTYLWHGTPSGLGLYKIFQF